MNDGPYAPTVRWFDIEKDPAGWDSLVDEQGLSLFHLSPVLEAHRYGKSVRRGVVVERAGRVVAAIGGNLAEGRRFTTLGFPRAGPEAPQDLPGRLSAWLCDQGVSELDVGSFDGGVEAYDAVAAGTPRDRLEFPWVLPPDASAVRAVLRTNHRRKLKKLDEIAATVRVIRSGQAWVLSRIRAHWEQRKGGRVRAWITLLNNHRFHTRVDRHMGRAGLATLYGMYDGEALLSIAYMLEFKARAFYMLGASSPLGYKVGASIGMFCQLAALYRARGVTVLNLGGVPKEAEQPDHEEHGVYRFKTGFGITPALHRSLYVVTSPGGIRN